MMTPTRTDAKPVSGRFRGEDDLTQPVYDKQIRLTVPQVHREKLGIILDTTGVPSASELFRRCIDEKYSELVKLGLIVPKTFSDRTAQAVRKLVGDETTT